MDVALNEDSIVYYAYYHGLFGSETWNQLQRDCCRNKICHFLTSENGNCRLKVRRASDFAMGPMKRHQALKYF